VQRPRQVHRLPGRLLACAKLLAIDRSSAAREQRELSRIGGPGENLRRSYGTPRPYRTYDGGSPVMPGSRAPPTLAPDPGREPTRTVELAQVQTREV